MDINDCFVFRYYLPFLFRPEMVVWIQKLDFIVTSIRILIGANGG